MTDRQHGMWSQFPLLQSEAKNGIFFIGLSGELEKLMHIDHKRQALIDNSTQNYCLRLFRNINEVDVLRV